ncbi:hypothetical protein G5714_023765 [Onychostoma macrolepis]|uniref:Uncharacterized protein n=1 Tax=Onychostoma macrolepis TaxID=369639 RepID=A0A7J6BHT4_9TELE|nr:hypothetical protein G5714_023765 [Onychostoma macrolepis]
MGEISALTDIEVSRVAVANLNELLRQLQVQRIRRKQLPGRPTQDIPAETIEAYLMSGVKAAEIARLFGVSEMTIRRRMCEYGISHSTNPVALTGSLNSEEPQTNVTEDACDGSTSSHSADTEAPTCNAEQADCVTATVLQTMETTFREQEALRVQEQREYEERLRKEAKEGGDVEGDDGVPRKTPKGHYGAPTPDNISSSESTLPTT